MVKGKDPTHESAWADGTCAHTLHAKVRYVEGIVVGSTDLYLSLSIHSSEQRI